MSIVNKEKYMNFGIICELNPLHKGHKHLFDYCKKNGDGLILAMSGNFTQRGDFAVYDKYERAKTAVENGADLVIEIPTVCALQSAQGYAKAGVKILEATGICDTLAFGAENADIGELKRVAKEITDRDGEITEALKSGLSYPAARQKVIASPLLATPNNILAIEYLTYTKLNAVAIKRIGKGHDTDDTDYSASEIRRHLNKNEICCLENCERAMLYKLRTMSAEDFAKIEDVSEGLENRIVSCVRDAKSINELYDMIKTKRYTHSRIRRIIMRAYLAITKDMGKEVAYLHILAFNETGRKMLAEMKEKAELPIITTYSGIKDEKAKAAFETEAHFTDIYSLGFKTPRICGEEQRAKVEIISE